MEQEEGTPQQSKGPKVMNPALRSVILGGMTLVLLVIVIWSSGRRTVSAVRSERIKAVAAVAASLKDDVIAGDRLKLQQVLNQIAERGSMQSITVTDMEGRAIASTDRQLDASTIKELGPPPRQARVSDKSGLTIVHESVWLAQDNAIGGIEVVYGPD